jgi:hypothetical protein
MQSPDIGMAIRICILPFLDRPVVEARQAMDCLPGFTRQPLPELLRRKSWFLRGDGSSQCKEACFIAVAH